MWKARPNAFFRPGKMHSGSAWTAMSIGLLSHYSIKTSKHKTKKSVGVLRPTFARHASEGILHAFFVARKTHLALVSYHVAILGSAGS